MKPCRKYLFQIKQGTKKINNPWFSRRNYWSKSTNVIIPFLIKFLITNGFFSVKVLNIKFLSSSFALSFGQAYNLSIYLHINQWSIETRSERNTIYALFPLCAIWCINQFLTYFSSLFMLTLSFSLPSFILASVKHVTMHGNK